MIAGLRNTPKAELDERKITRSIRDAFDAIDSGHPTSPNDLSEAQLLPGIVQDLQNLRLKFEQTVSSSSTKSERQRPLSFDSGCQTDVSVSSKNAGKDFMILVIVLSVNCLTSENSVTSFFASLTDF